MTTTAIRHPDVAPCFPDTPGYPERGRRIGPAWQWMWTEITARPTEYQRITEIVTTVFGISEKSVQNILLSARRHGFVDISDEPLWRDRTITRTTN